MNPTITLKQFRDLSEVAVQVAPATAPTLPQVSLPPDDASDDDFRERVRRGDNPPRISTILHGHWGINE